MTTEQKAKAYDEALAKCKAYIEDTKKRWSEEFCKATEKVFEEIFPQLKESKDEKIRKWLIEEIKATHDYDSPTSRKCVDDALAYLEKMKEFQFDYPAIYFYDGKKLHFQGNPAMEEKQKEQKPDVFGDTLSDSIPDDWLTKLSTNDSSNATELKADNIDAIEACMLRYLQSAANRKDDVEIMEDTREYKKQLVELIQKPVKCELEDAFKNYTDAGITISCGDFVAKPKEQKPAEWSEVDERYLIWLCRIIHSRVVNKELSLTEESKLGKWIDKWINHKPQPVQKWDDFDEDCLKRAIWYIENPAPLVVKDSNLVLWLQSLPERFNLQPKQEWSERENKMLASAISHIRDSECFDHFHDITKEDIISWLISLRPSWKPSEEQMKALSWAINYLADIEQGCASTLALLKFNLKELM